MFQCDYENVITWLDLTINELTWLNANKFPLRQFCPASWLSIYVPTMFTISSLTIIIQCATISSDLIWINNALNVVSTILSSGNNAVHYEILVWRLFEMHFFFVPSITQGTNVSYFSPNKHLRLNGHFFNCIPIDVLSLSHLFLVKKCHWDFLPP